MSSWGLTIDDIGGDVVINKEQNIAMPNDVESLLAENPDISIVGRNKRGRRGEDDENASLRQTQKTGQKKPVTSQLEIEFLALWEALCKIPLQREYRFHDKRGWLLDFAETKTQVAIEIEGGVWSRGRHTRGAGFIEDCIKYNQAALNGWTVFRLTTGLITPEHVQPIIDYTRKVARLNGVKW